MKITVNQALLILIKRYRNQEDKLQQLKSLLITGAKGASELAQIQEWLQDEVLEGFEISMTPEDISDDASRRYFETILAHNTLVEQLTNIPLSVFEAHLCAIELIVPYTWKEHVFEEIYRGVPGQGQNEVELEYADFIGKIKDGRFMPTLSAEDRQKVEMIAKASFAAMIIASNAAYRLPLNIYGKDAFARRGKLSKGMGHELTRNAHYGLLRGHDAVATDDAAHMEETYQYLKPSDQSTFDKSSEMVKRNFAQLVHPFSNGISGTMLCQLRALLKIKNHIHGIQDETTESAPIVQLSEFQAAIDEQPHLMQDPELLRKYLQLFCSTLLFNAGGHSIYEYLAPLQLDEVREGFRDVQGFELLDSEHIFLMGNDKAFDRAVDQAIEYNDALLKRRTLAEQISKLGEQRNFDGSLSKQILESTLSTTIKNKLLGLARFEPEKAKSNLIVAIELHNIVFDNGKKIGQQTLSFLRQGSRRHVILQDGINNALSALAEGQSEKAMQQIVQLKIALGKFHSFYSQATFPEEDKLDEVIERYHKRGGLTPEMQV